MNFPRLSLPFDVTALRVRQWIGVAAILLIALALGVMAARRALQWEHGRRPLDAAQTQSIEVLARGTQSPAVWALYQSESAGGLTRAGAERVRNAAKAASPPDGLLANP
jgi:hypothetical protein